GSAGTCVWLTHKLVSNRRAVLWTALVLVLSPMLAVLGSVMAPDTAAIFFSVCALVCAVRLADDPRMDGAVMWLLFGLFCGLALLTKYTAILLPASVVAALLTDRRGRAHFRRPWIYLAALEAL